MPSLAEILRSVAGACRILAFRPEGLGYFATDRGAVWRSFFAMVLAAPAFVLQLEAFRAELALEAPELHFYAIWTLTYLCFWFAFPLVLLKLSEKQPFAARVPFYIAAGNWVSVPASYLKLASSFVAEGQGLGEAIDIVVIVWLLTNAWWLLRRVLQIGPGQAVALVLLSELTTYALFFFAVSRTALPALAGG